MRFQLTAAAIGLLLGAAGFGALAVWQLRRGRAGRPAALRRVPWLLFAVFVLLVFAALVRTAEVALTGAGRLG